MELAESEYEMLRNAVNTAREHQVRSVKSLKARLLEIYPDREGDIDAAIKFWSGYVLEQYRHRPPSRFD